VVVLLAGPSEYERSQALAANHHPEEKSPWITISDGKEYRAFSGLSGGIGLTRRLRNKMAEASASRIVGSTLKCSFNNMQSADDTWTVKSSLGNANRAQIERGAWSDD
jgi:hypothetical protein